MTPWNSTFPGFPVLHYFLELAQTHVRQGFPGSSAGKDSTYNAGDPGSIPGLGRSAGEGIGYPLQYSGLENFVDCIQSMGSQRVRHD